MISCTKQDGLSVILEGDLLILIDIGEISLNLNQMLRDALRRYSPTDISGRIRHENGLFGAYIFLLHFCILKDI